MKEVQVTAATVEEAWEEALEELGVSAEEAKMEVIEQRTTGRLLGMLSQKQVTIRAWVQEKDRRSEEAVQHLQTMLDMMGIDADVDLVEETDEEILLDIRGPDLGIVIGGHGQTLNALQLITNIMVNRGREVRKRVVVDAEGYRDRRRRSLENMALSKARQAKEQRREVILEDLRAAERRIIHTILQHDPDVVTFSEGEEPNRRLVISPRD